MFNPEYADAIVENMPVTMLRCWGLVLSDYPNVLKQTVETMATEDPRIVTRYTEQVDIKDAALLVELQIDVLEPEMAEVTGPEIAVVPKGHWIGKREWTVHDVTLSTSSDDGRGEITCDVVITYNDYLARDCETYEDTDNLKYERSAQVVFYVKA